MATLKQVLFANRYPCLAEFVERLDLRIQDHPNTLDGSEAASLRDELLHLVVRAFKSKDMPE